MEKINKVNKSLARLIKEKKKKGRRLKSVKLEMKMKLQLTPQKYQGSQETTMNDYMPIKQTMWKKYTNS